MNPFLSCTAVILLHVAVGQKPQDGAPCDPTLWDEGLCKELLRKKCTFGSRDCEAFAARHSNGLNDDFKKVLYELCDDMELCLGIMEFYFFAENDMARILSVYAGIPDNLDRTFIKIEMEDTCVSLKPPCKELDGIQDPLGRHHVCMNKTDECVTMLRSHCKGGNEIGAFCDDVYNKISPKNIPNNKIVEIACAIKLNNEFDLPNVCDDVSASSIWAEEGVVKQCTTREAHEKKEICKIMKGACGVDAYKAKVYCKEYSEVNAKLEEQENVEMCKNAANSGKKDELSNCLSMASKICPKAAANAKCVPIFSAAFDAIKDKASLVKTALHTWCQDFPKEDNPEVSDTLKDKMTVCYMFADNVDKGSMMDKVFAAKKSDEADECDIEKTNKFNDHDKHCKFIENYCSNKTANSCKVLNENIKTQRWNKDLCADKDNCTAALDKYCIKSTAKCQDTIDLLQKDHLQDPIIIGMCNITGSGDHCEKIVDKFIKLKVSTDVVNKTCTEQTVETTFCQTLTNKCKDETAGDECPLIMGYMNSLNTNGKDSSDKDEIENLENQILYCQIGAGVGGALCVLSFSMFFVCKGMANKSKIKKKGGGSDDSTQL